MEMSQLDSDLRLPPRKRLLAGYKKLNSNSIGSSSSSSTSISNGSSSASTSRFHNDLNQSPEELVEAARSAATLAVKAAKAARAMANEKALISSKAIAAAKKALELVDSFPKEAMADCNVSLDHLSLKGELRYEEEDLAGRLQRAIERMYPLKVLGTREENGRKNKKLKMNSYVAERGSRVTSYMNDNYGVVDSDISFDGLESNRKAGKGFKLDELDSIPTPGKEKAEEQRRGRVKLKKLPLSICNSRDQEKGIISCESPVQVAQPQENGVVPVISGQSSLKCRDVKAPECVKQNKPVRS